MPKILCICTNADLAGAPIHVAELVCGLKSQFNFVVILGEDGPVAERLRASGVLVYIVYSLKSPVNPIKDLIALIHILILTAIIKPDLFHLHSAKAGIVGRVVGFLTRIPCLYTVHGWPWRGFGKIKFKLILFIERCLAILPAAFVYVARDVEVAANLLLGIARTRGMVIYNAVPDHFICDESDGPLRIMMAARVCPAKDHKTLICAFEKLDFDSELTLCGEGTNTPEFLLLAKIWAPTRFCHIKFLGVRNDVREIMMRSNVVTLCSRYEALPLSVIEGMASRRAVIATSVGGIPEIIRNNINGLLVGDSDVDAWVSAFCNVRTKEARFNLSFCARTDFEANFSLPVMLSKVSAAYSMCFAGQTFGDSESS